MSGKIKVRNIRNEYKYSFAWNLFVVFVTLMLSYTFMPATGPIGNRTMFAMYFMDGVLTLLFMYWLEKYTITISGLYEETVISLLANLYTLCIMTGVNIIFFTSLRKGLADVAVFVLKNVAVYAIDLLLLELRKNPKIRRKPRLLIIDATKKNQMRMERIIGGCVKNFICRQESIEGKTLEEFKVFVDETLPEFEAICVLDGVSSEEYSIAVGKAVELNKDLFIVPKLIDVGKTNARIARFDDVLTLYMPKKYLTKLERFTKRVVDIVLSSVGLVFAVVPMIVIALLIKLSSPGPVFYKQTRLTRNKKEFEIYKFRTMIPDAEKLTGPKFAEKDDPRITPIGKFLRACRLDELPQIINILKGDMSIVGPRPERPVFVEQFEHEIQNYDYRFEVKAGLTSLSHVYGRYSTNIYDRTYYDLFYITHYSLLLDFKIILLTTKTMFLKSASEGVEVSDKKADVSELQEV